MDSSHAQYTQIVQVKLSNFISVLLEKGITQGRYHDHSLYPCTLGREDTMWSQAFGDGLTDGQGVNNKYRLRTALVKSK